MDSSKIELISNHHEGSSFILKDDFFTIRKTYFNDLIKSRNWYALPGGIQDNYSHFYHNFPNLNISQDELAGYKIDSGSNLENLKMELLPLISRWENRDISIDEFTICPSVTLALLICFAYLKSKGISNIVHETPSYFASVQQTKELGLKNSFIPTLQKYFFKIQREDLAQINRKISRYVLVMTNPKIGIGNLLTETELTEIHKEIKPSSFLVLDEAANRLFPSTTSFMSTRFENTFRIKGFFKGLGFNGIRATIIFHHAEHKRPLGSILETLGGTMDSYSIKMLFHISKNIGFYTSCLESASSHVKTCNRIVEKHLIGSNAKYFPIENGYIGLVKIPFNTDNFSSNRDQLLRMAKELKTPLVLGSSMYFPYDGSAEWVRLNLFSSAENLVRSVEVLDKVSSTFKK